ncbi:MAG: 2,3-bisphosphoglycerate-independent phosphoglycerate mutase [Patescibacteria group bacterium]|nr:2,3-bisphosphoglycerate-independent phosphoglycerate mutase [Patescibacteria group bacterium]MDD5121357.1 2,3-bisphosphoglycerate-independent phosphoglycerate mutase [Patescibacteria group bacterium]MDD5222069.1 2,3-bisphosphoglycerate-independent phosphoglycerate mutase [Patescibacteria group bacterium]MDD5395724.1 2,3-bisphosphoglycerate-independent phosphoglycerate mutase [Patescibacteria group bacterium]
MEEIKPKIKPVVLVVLDGWGVAAPSQGNAVTLTDLPVWQKLLTNYSAWTLQAAGEAVGLPFGEAGNSEVGHLNLGAGKIVWQSLPKINRSIADGEFFKNSAFIKAIESVKKNNSKLHLIGLTSNGAVHSSLEHLSALLDLAKSHDLSNVFVHAILDGRDTAFNIGESFIKQIQDKCQRLGCGKIATLCGRFYAMDRDNYWDRTQKAYEAMINGKADKTSQNPIQAVLDSYEQKIFDEEFLPTVIVDEKNQPITTIDDKDAVIFFNFRPERMRQLTRAITVLNFKNFTRAKLLADSFFVTMTEYEPGLPVQVAFPPERVEQPLAKIISDAGWRQLHVAETQKYAHVTFFFNGGAEKPFKQEDRLLIPSPRISSFDQKPAMAASEISAAVIKALDLGVYDFVVVNFANADMVSHTGNLEAAQKSLQVVDEELGKILLQVLKQGGVALITADHGNIEEMVNLRNGEINKEHSTSPVPFIIVGNDFELSPHLDQPVDLSALTPSGVLADVAPTILKLMGLPKSPEMTGTSLA